MATMIRNGYGISRSVLKFTRVACLDSIVIKRCVSAGSSEHTLRVKQQIQDTRKKTLEGGGQKRIDAQHKKVLTSRSVYG